MVFLLVISSNSEGVILLVGGTYAAPIVIAGVVLTLIVMASIELVAGELRPL